jgi:hypothetical protein
MFAAFVIVCAVNFNMEIDQSRCLQFDDDWGPYSTEENCMIRANQMSEEVGKGDINTAITIMLEYPPLLYSEGRCVLIEDTSV